MPRVMLTVLVLLAAFTGAAWAQPTREDALAAMKKAAAFMTGKVAHRGGYVWTVSEDLSQRWGEVPARPSQIWVQAGTPAVGDALIDAYEATGDAFYLDAARRAADALVFGQHPLGGWHYFVDFDPAGLPAWYEASASRFRYGYEEYRHYYGNCTFDDAVTPDATAYLLRFYTVSREPAYRAPLLKALEFVLQAQYPVGAWPQRYPLRHEFAHDGLPDYTSYFTLNDGAHRSAVELMLAAYEALGDARYLESAQRGAAFLMAAQGPEGQAAWAEQFGPDMEPVAARTHEPAGFVLRESRDAIEVLEMLYLLTGHRRYLRPIPACLAWFDRVEREIAASSQPVPRYWEPGTNRPLYVVRADARTPEGYGRFTWTTTPPPAPPGPRRFQIDVAAVRADYEAVARLTSPEARAAFYERRFRKPSRATVTPARVLEIITALDARGAWVTDGIRVHPPAEDGWRTGDLVAVRGISTSVFVSNLRTLADYVRQVR